VACDIDPNKLPPSQSYDQQNVQLDKADGGNHKQIDRCDVRRMVAQKSAPGLARRATSLGHVLGNSRLSDGLVEMEPQTIDRCDVRRMVAQKSAWPKENRSPGGTSQKTGC
jgi:hypothetical protein